MCFSWLCISKDLTCYRCYHILSNRVFVSRHIIFDETVFPFKQTTLQDTNSESTLDGPHLLPLHKIQSSLPRSNNTNTDHTNTGSADSGIIDISTTDISIPDISDTVQQIVQHTSSSPSQTTNTHCMVTRSKDNSRRPKNFSDYVALTSNTVPKLNTVPDFEPRTYNQAKEYPHWRDAMAKEITALAENNTWTLVPPTANQNLVDCKWVFKVKKNSDRSIERYKARLVARGFTQEEGTDYFDTFSPVVRPTTIRLILSIAISQNWKIHQLNVQNAFLHGDLQEAIFMTQPPGFINDQYPDYVCHLKKAIYSLKQSPRAWFYTLSSALLQLGFQGSKHDPSLFILHKMNHLVVILVYVDDIIITSSSTDLMMQIIQSLQGTFKLKDLGSLHYFLGIAVKSTSTGTFLSQHKYTQELLCKAKMQSAKPLPTPMAVNTVLSKHDGEPFDDPHLYRVIVGALQYLTITRPDIAFSVNKASQFMHTPTTTHWAAVKRILRHLVGTSTHGLQIKASSDLRLHAYFDADWAGCPDDRWSTSGFCIYLGPNIISWSSKKQHTVSKSSTEAEYRSLAQASAELIWV